MKPKKHITANLAFWQNAPGGACYVVESLRNATSVSLGSSFFRVGDTLTQAEADELVRSGAYEITVSAFKR